MRFLLIWLLLAMPMTAGAADVPGAQAAMDAFRAGVGKGRVTLDPGLQKVAEAHAGDMARHGYFSHYGRTGSTPGKRATRAGYKWCWVAENIAKGQKSVAEVMASWSKSLGHRKNMAHAKAREFGLARAPGNVWVMVLARPC